MNINVAMEEEEENKKPHIRDRRSKTERGERIEKVEDSAAPTVTFQGVPSPPLNKEPSSILASTAQQSHRHYHSSFSSNRHQLILSKYFVDHTSLLVPSSTVRFRGQHVDKTGLRASQLDSFYSHGCHVVENENHQLILEEKIDFLHNAGGNTRRTIEIKRVRNNTKGLQLLRAFYTIICILFVGVLLAFAIQLTLNLVLDLCIISGQTTTQTTAQWYNAPPLILALWQFCNTFAEGMVIATRFIIDAWSGHYLVKEFFPFPKMKKRKFGCGKGHNGNNDQGDRALGRTSSDNLVFVDWFFFIFLLLIPLLVCIATLFAGLDNWWVISGVTWFSCVAIFFLLFAGYTVYYEVSGAISFVQNHRCYKHQYENDRNENVESETTTSISLWEACKRCILMRQIRRYSGKKRARYFATSLVDRNEMMEDDKEQQEDDSISEDNNNNDGNDERIVDDSDVDIIENSYQERMGIWSKLTLWSFLSKQLRVFKVLEHPKKLYDINDAQGLRPFVTKWTWSLERIFCNPKSSRFIVIIDGPGAITRNQVLSSLSCSIIGTCLIVLLIISFLTWFGLSKWVIVLMVILLVIVLYNNLKRVRKTAGLIFRLNQQKQEFQAEDKFTAWFFETNQIQQQEEEANSTVEEDSQEKRGVDASDQDVEGGAKDGKDKDIDALKSQDRRQLLQRNISEYTEGASTGLYIAGNDYRVSEASEWLCWFVMFWEIALFFVWPVVVLYALKTSIVATLYLVSVLISGFRHYFNIVAVIEETGTMNLSLPPGKSRTERWRKQARLTSIVDKISTDKSKRAWLIVLGVLGVIFLALFVGGMLQLSDEATGDTTQLTYLPEWYYPPQRGKAQYPTCVFGKPPSAALENYTLADFAFLSSLAYRDDNIVDGQLESWFGPSGEKVTDEREFVQEWKQSQDIGNLASFKLFRFQNSNGTSVGIVSVRGTANMMDLLVDNQLWQAAMLAQAVRAALPFGGIFTPVLPTLVLAINAIQGDALRRVSYYKSVTLFLEDLQNSTEYFGLGLTGHSLGGGVAIISAAQTGVSAVAISGPNAMLSRLSFEPSLSVEALNSYTFNVVPERDLIPKFDDLAQNYQNIRCQSSSRNPLSCHSMLRSLCELMYTCGTNNRPAICECHTAYGYPMPLTEGNQSFAELCADAPKSF